MPELEIEVFLRDEEKTGSEHAFTGDQMGEKSRQSLSLQEQLLSLFDDPRLVCTCFLASLGHSQAESPFETEVHIWSYSLLAKHSRPSLSGGMTSLSQEKVNSVVCSLHFDHCLADKFPGPTILTRFSTVTHRSRR